MTIEFMNQLQEIAKTKKDGVYSKKGTKYAVKNGHVVLYAEYNRIYHQVGIFSVFAGAVEIYDIRKRMLEMLSKV